jgi:FlaA1/EpsC-like NDP-sugar epimerase
VIKHFILRHSNIIVSRWIVVLIDLLLLNSAIILANILRFDFVLSEVTKYHILAQLLTVTSIGIATLMMNGAHKGIIRHTSQSDMLRIVKAITLLVMLIASINYAILLLGNTGRTMIIGGSEYSTLIPNSVLIIFYPLALFFLLLFRLTIKLAYYSITTTEKGEKVNVLIYGAGKEGLSVMHTLTGTHASPFRVVGFMDDQPGKIGKSVQGLSIYNPGDVTNAFLAKRNITEVILAMPNISEEQKTEIYNRLISLEVIIKSVPPIDTWINGELNLKQIQNLNIEDLLQREAIRLDNQEVLRGTFGKTVLVTGAAGSIGHELSRQLLYFNPRRIVLVDQAETPLFELEQDLTKLELELEGRKYHEKVSMEFVIADVSNEKCIGALIRSVKPHLIYHAAAYKHVPLMEANPLEAIRVNVFGTGNLADAASEAGVEKFIMISTDKAVNPTNVMGATKRLAEIYIQSLNFKPGNKTAFITTRFGNVLGSNGSVTRTFKKQILAGGPVTVTHPEITRYFMTIPEACQLVFEAGAMGKGGEIFIFDMGKPVRILDMAKNIIRLSGFTPDREIKIVFTGLRPGEKLYEELLNDKERTMATHHPKIMIAKVRDYPFAEVKEMIEELAGPFHQGNPRAAVKMIKEFIPEYISNNSVYRTLDFDFQPGREGVRKAK